MEWLPLLYEILQVCVIPLLGVLTAYIVKFINVKSLEIQSNVSNNMADKYITRLTVLSENNDIAEKIKIELMLSDTGIDEKSRITKQSEKVGFYEALDLAVVWLERSNKE